MDIGFERMKDFRVYLTAFGKREDSLGVINMSTSQVILIDQRLNVISFSIHRVEHHRLPVCPPSSFR